jgi:acyl carrier protein
MAEQTANPMTAIDAEAVTQRVREVVADSLEKDVAEVKLDSSFFELGAESLDLLDMAFALEKEYQIQFPRTDILERASARFGEENLVAGGVVTDLGLKLLVKGMPELDPERIKPGLKAIEVAKMITVGSFVRITLRLLEAKAEFPRACPKCGGVLQESDTMPEFECPDCHTVVPLPSGDDVLLQDVVSLWEENREA